MRPFNVVGKAGRDQGSRSANIRQPQIDRGGFLVRTRHPCDTPAAMLFYVYEIEDAAGERQIALRHEDVPVSGMTRPGERIIRFLCVRDLTFEEATDPSLMGRLTREFLGPPKHRLN